MRFHFNKEVFAAFIAFVAKAAVVFTENVSHFSFQVVFTTLTSQFQSCRNQLKSLEQQ